MSAPQTPSECIAEIDRIIGEIKRSMERPGWERVTSRQMRIQANYKRSIATTVKLSGGAVRPEYE